MLLRVMIHSLHAEKGHDEHAEGVQRRDEYAPQHAKIRITRAEAMRHRHGVYQRVLGKESSRARESDQRKATHEGRPKCDRQVLAQPAHLSHVLLMVHGHDDRPRGQEQQRLEEGMRHQMEDAGAVGRHAERHRHVTQLRQRRVRHHPLDVVVDDAQQPHEKRGGRADDEDERQRRLRQLEQRRHARHHEDARSHHGGGVDQRRNGRRTFHRVGQPYVQRHLGRFGHGADEQADARERDGRPGDRAAHVDLRARESIRMGEHRRIVERARVAQHRRDSQHEAEIADAVDQERLEVRDNGRRPGVPEPDQQIGDQAHAFPAEEQLHEVVGHHQHQHREGEQRNVGEEALVAIVLVHVADGVDMHHQGHEGHHHHHHGGQVVDQEADLHRQAVAHQPGIDRGIEWRHPLVDELVQHVQRECARQAHAGDGDAVRTGLPDGPAEQARDNRRDQWRQRNRKIDRLHFSAYPLTLERVEIFDIDRAAFAEQDDEDGKTDCRFRRRHRQDEKDEDLAVDVAEEPRERHEIEVHRQQHQLDAHQQHDDVAAVQEHAGDGDREQDAGQCKDIGERYHERFSEVIFTMRTRSLGLTATCLAMS